MRTHLTFVSFFLISVISSFAQHPDESQMLFKPGTREAHARAHAGLPSAKSASAAVTMPSDSIARSEAAADIDDSGEDADEYLQAGIRMLQRGDSKAALKNLGEASRRGNHEAQYRIGLMYRDGVGLNANPTEAAYWFRKAGSNGHAAAQYEIARCFETGEGVLADRRVAAEWYWRSAQQGYAPACFRMGCIYRDGTGMDTDLRKAEKYMKTAAEAGVEGAGEALEEIRRRLPKAPAAPSSKSKTKRRSKR